LGNIKQGILLCGRIHVHKKGVTKIISSVNLEYHDECH